MLYTHPRGRSAPWQYYGFGYFNFNEIHPKTLSWTISSLVSSPTPKLWRTWQSPSHIQLREQLPLHSAFGEPNCPWGSTPGGWCICGAFFLLHVLRNSSSKFSTFTTYEPKKTKKNTFAEFDSFVFGETPNSFLYMASHILMILTGSLLWHCCVMFY